MCLLLFSRTLGETAIGQLGLDICVVKVRRASCGGGPRALESRAWRGARYITLRHSGTGQHTPRQEPRSPDSRHHDQGKSATSHSRAGVSRDKPASPPEVFFHLLQLARASSDSPPPPRGLCRRKCSSQVETCVTLGTMLKVQSV